MTTSKKISRCPLCAQKSGQRKLPLLIHVLPRFVFALNYTCRFCSACDLLVAHKHEIEGMLAAMFRQNDPSVIGNDYLVSGTVEKSAWREGMEQSMAMEDMLAHSGDFAVYYE